MKPPTIRTVMTSGATLLLLGILAMSVPPSSASQPGKRTGPVCFWSDQGPVCVARADGVVPAALSAEGLLAALLAGPTAEEQAQGLWSAVPAGTMSRGVEERHDGTVIVRLEVVPEALRELDHDTFEIIVQQIGWTLEPLSWQDLRIQTWNPATEAFVSLADFLPQIPDPRKKGAAPPPSLAQAGQPPAPGQGQPQGALSGKTVYVSAGHGWQWSGYDWRTQRPPYPYPPYEGPIIEDHNNAEAVDQYLLTYLWNAGARVIPARERNMNSTQVVVDDGGAGYSQTGSWTTESGSGYAGGDYRWATTVTGAPTASAEWSATLPTDGRYAVYVWYRQAGGHTTDARYTIHHAGGATEVTLNQRIHGNTWHHVGTYGFRGGELARVALTNLSATASGVVVADAVRFGGGTFDDLAGIVTAATYPPNEPWWEVAAYYYTQRMGMGQPPGDVTARPIYARWEHAGSGEDALYVSWHTNGISGYQWDSHGTVSIIHNGEGKPITPGSVALRDAIHAELVHDLQVGWDAGWPGYKRSMNLGELRLLWDSDPAVRMPGTLIEVAYHDHPNDTDALKEPRFNMLAARAIYQGIVNYFEQRDGVPLTLLPEPPTHLAVQNAGGGQVRVSWQPSPTDATGLVGDPASGYRVYTSTNGLGWSNGVVVTAGTVYTLTGLSPGQLLFVRVSATNAGGESFPTETLAIRAEEEIGVLLVNGFDRLNRTMIVAEHDPVEGDNMRMFLDQMNRYDYAIQHGQAISYPFDSASNEAVRDGLILLSNYALVDWILGEESVPDETLDATERTLLTSFLANGGALFLSGTEVGYHLDGQGADPGFYNTILRADYAGDDAGTYEVAPATGSIFAGLDDFRFDAAGEYDADFPDYFVPINGATTALAYATGPAAAIQYASGCQRLVYFGFPFETISSAQQLAVMQRVLGFLDECLGLPFNTTIVSPIHGSAHNDVPPFEGTASVYSGTLQRVEVQARRVGSGEYWTGSTWAAGPTWLTATGTASWSYALPALSDSGSDDGDYHLQARAWTTDGYSDTSPAAATFVYDTISPTATTLITPTGGITVAAATVSLAWQPVSPDGGSSLGYVAAVDGQPYTTTESVYTVTHAPAGLHTWGVQVFDAAGNRSGWVTDTFYLSVSHYWLPLVMRGYEEAPPVCSDVIVNGGFESNGGWVFNRATYNTNASYVHLGARSAQVGILPGEPGGGTTLYSSVRQQVAVTPGSSATLRLWVYPISENNDPGDLHYVWLSEQGEGYEPLDWTTSDARAWEQRAYDVSAYLGQTVTIYIGAKNDGDDDTAALYVDDVALEVCP
jgi:N-acetylmuramoyl-L-alanine amidase